MVFLELICEKFGLDFKKNALRRYDPSVFAISSQEEQVDSRVRVPFFQDYPGKKRIISCGFKCPGCKVHLHTKCFLPYHIMPSPQNKWTHHNWSTAATQIRSRDGSNTTTIKQVPVEVFLAFVLTSSVKESGISALSRHVTQDFQHQTLWQSTFKNTWNRRHSWQIHQLTLQWLSHTREFGAREL